MASTNRSDRQSRAAFTLKIIMVAASFAAGAAQFRLTPTGDIPLWNVIGLFGVGALALFSVCLLFMDDNAPKELNIARRAVEQARNLFQLLNDDYEEAAATEANLRRATELYNAMTSMREVIEQSAGAPLDDVALINLLTTAAGRALMVASDFKLAEHWTLLVYRAEAGEDGSSRQLRCVGGKRSIECELVDARVWPEGVGAGGIALSRGQEVLVPDLAAPELGTLHQIGSLQRSHDDGRFRSIAAVPILVGRELKPWGVVVATSDRAGHFGVEVGPGVRTAEASRALAGMVALAVALRERGAAPETRVLPK